MTPQEYLQQVLKGQELPENGPERKQLSARREAVEAILRTAFSEGKPTIRYGGSISKGTLIRENYDLDLICYFPSDNDAAGATLEQIYNNLRKTLELEYYVLPKSSALRLKDKSNPLIHEDFHIDVVPGRYIDASKQDVFIYQNGADKNWLKTNLDVHIAHVKNSGLIDEIKIAKLWNERKQLRIKTFVLELLVIKILKSTKQQSLDKALLYFWETLRDKVGTVAVEDPANPQGNDLSAYVTDSFKAQLSMNARMALEQISKYGWENLFGPAVTSTSRERIQVIQSAPSVLRAKPWSH